MVFTCRTVEIVCLCCGLVKGGISLCCGLVYSDKVLAIEGDKVNLIIFFRVVTSLQSTENYFTRTSPLCDS